MMMRKKREKMRWLSYFQFNRKTLIFIKKKKEEEENSETSVTDAARLFCSRLGNPFSPGFPTRSTNPGLKVPSFSPGLTPGTKGDGWKHQPGVKGASRPGQALPQGRTFSPGWCYQPGLNVPLFFLSFFWFLFLVPIFGFFFHLMISFDIKIHFRIRC